MKMILKPAALAALVLLSGVATSSLAQSRKTYIVQLKDEPAASYQGTVSGYAATQPAPAGNTAPPPRPAFDARPLRPAPSGFVVPASKTRSAVSCTDWPVMDVNGSPVDSIRRPISSVTFVPAGTVTVSAVTSCATTSVRSYRRSVATSWPSRPATAA